MVNLRHRLLPHADIDHDASLDALGHLMDTFFVVPGLGWRFGLNTLFDLVPGFGDAATSVVAVVILLAAVRRGVPRPTLVRMALNVGIYSVGGIVPLLGDLFDSWWKPNRRNLDLLARARHDAKAAHRHDAGFIVALLGGVFLVILASAGMVAWLLHALWVALAHHA